MTDNIARAVKAPSEMDQARYAMLREFGLPCCAVCERPFTSGVPVLWAGYATVTHGGVLSFTHYLLHDSCRNRYEAWELVRRVAARRSEPDTGIAMVSPP